MKRLFALIIISVALYGDIGGLVFKDYNLNGKLDKEDSPVSNIPLKAICSDGNVYTTTTKEKGQYLFTIPGSLRCRVEIDNSLNWISSANNGVGNASGFISFVENGNLKHNISISSISSYCQKNPKVLITALPGGSICNAGAPQEHGALFNLPTPKIGTFDKDFTKRESLKKRKEIGAVWGLAYDKINKNIFVASVIKRYVPLLHGCKDEDKNQNGCAGRIYKISNDGKGEVKLLTDLGNSEVGYILKEKRDYDGTSKQMDKEVVPLAGRAGLGDLEISEDGKYLYTINLYKKELIKIDSSTGEIIFKKKIPNPYAKECKNEKVRPWALKVLDGNVFIGSVCENKISNGYPLEADHTGELGAAIQKFDGENFTLFAMTNTLNYLKPRPYDPEKPNAEPPSQIDQNNNWEDKDDYNQPMLTDIEFDNARNLILAYTDRGAFIRNRGNSSGDLRRMCKNPDGTYTDESTGVAKTDCPSTMHRYRKNGKMFYEFYVGDFYDEFNNQYGAKGHPETAAGSVAMRPGDSNLYLGMVDSTASYEPGSIGILSNETGEKLAAQALINPAKVSNGGERELYGSKAGGIGDIELLCDLAPAEIGNYIWEDTNENGIQDPDEYGICGVKVKLFLGKNCSGTEIGEATTNSNGEYYFGGVNNTNLKKGFKIEPDKEYSICIPLVDRALDNMALTKRDVGGEDLDRIDSDAKDDGNGYAKINFKTDKANRSNHTLDAGFVPNTKASLGGKVWNDENKNGIQDDNELGVVGVRVNLFKSDGTKIDTTTTNSAGKYLFEGLEAGEYYVVFDLNSIPKDFKVSPKDVGGDDNLDSDADPKTGKTPATTLEAGESDLSWDMGIYKESIEPKYCIGDFVWEDSNKNGIQDSTEKGVGGVKLKLLPTNATTTTNSNGKYSFCNLKKGEYKVEVISIPNGFALTKPNAGDDNKDSDINPATRLSQNVTINDKNITNLDVGIYKLPEPKYCIGDFVWEDSNKNGIQDSTEKGVGGVKLILLPVNKTTTTDSSGIYHFCDLKKGDYWIQVDKNSLPNGYFIGPKGMGEDPNKDSDINPMNAKSDKISLKDKNITNIDLGLIVCGDGSNSITNNNSSYCTGPGCNTPVTSGDNTKHVINDTKNDNEPPQVKIAKIDIEKHTNKQDADTKEQAVPLIDGDSITWEYIVANIGDDAIDNIKVVDDKEGTITCPKTSLAPATRMICTKKGSAKYEEYKNTATVTGKARSTGVIVKDQDSSCYRTRYIIGSHFWIDKNKNGIYEEGIDEPIPNALIELFDGNGNKIAQTRTNAKGEYHFYVKAGSYYVRFHLPEKYKEKGYVFETPKGNDDNNINANNANEQGFTRLVTVGPNADDRHKTENLTLDAAIDCGCDAPGIDQGSGDALSKFAAFVMIILTLFMALLEINRRRV